MHYIREEVAIVEEVKREWEKESDVSLLLVNLDNSRARDDVDSNA